MSDGRLVLLVAGFVLSLLSCFFISSEHRVTLSRGDQSPKNSPLLGPGVDAVKFHQSVLEILEEYKFPKLEPANPLDVDATDMRVPFHGYWRCFPILFTLFVQFAPIVLWATGFVFTSFVYLTVYAMYSGWKMGLHVGLFSYVGLKKVKHFANADFEALYHAQPPPLSSPMKMEWKDVTHFVLLVNYKEDEEVMRRAMESIARSPIAEKQIGLVLAMEEREEGAQAKAESLMGKYKHRFRHVHATYHPPGLPGETPGKSSNTKWAAEQLLSTFMPKHQIDIATTILTVADADSDFHREYFACVTYMFLQCGGTREDWQTPERYLTIWQAPILHMKNYIQQPSIVRLASFMTSLHELANLSDPNSVRIPYSTYSVSAVLAKKVNGWDPDWISEDWHMALKCFLATKGKCKVSPVFYPILNYSPEADSIAKTVQARWEQAKRHALGFSEIVYWGDHMFRCFRETNGAWNRVLFCWRGFFLWWKLLMIHVVMATLVFINPFNGFLMAWFGKNHSDSVNSVTFLFNIIVQAISCFAFTMIAVSATLLFEALRDRIDGADAPDLPPRWRNKSLNLIFTIFQSGCFLPFFLFFAAAAEWIAALKCLKSHKFEYIVAAKPKLQAEEVGNQS